VINKEQKVVRLGVYTQKVINITLKVK